MEARDGTFTLSSKARQDLLQIGDFLGQRDKKRTMKWFQMARQTFEELAQTPFMGSIRPQDDSRLHSIRGWPVRDFRSYLILYRPLASENGVIILRVTHSSRHITPLLEETLDE